MTPALPALSARLAAVSGPLPAVATPYPASFPVFGRGDKFREIEVEEFSGNGNFVREDRSLSPSNISGRRWEKRKRKFRGAFSIVDSARLFAT